MYNTPLTAMERYELPKDPWQDIAMDLLGPMPRGEYILDAVDYFSRFPEVVELQRMTPKGHHFCLTANPAISAEINSKSAGKSTPKNP